MPKLFNALIIPLALITLLTASISAVAKPAKQPNFVWLLSEDSGREHFQLYNKQGAKTPNIEKLAAKGMVFERALSNAPVCSVARSTLATGAYAPRIGVQYHRAWQYANLPSNLQPISKMLMNNGYYVSNNYKTDYNFTGTKSFWHETGKQASWQKRAKDQPFFHMQTWETTHSSRLHYPQAYVTTKKTKHDPSVISVAPYYPNTATFRYTYARYLDKIQQMDQQVGDVIAQLEAEGLLEDTFIFFFGDHGGPLPGSKGYLFDRGLHTPLVVRIPENFKHLVSSDMQNLANTRVNGIVSFVDFAPTLAKLAGLEQSAQHDGQAFLGKGISLQTLNQRATSYSYADRFDERSSLLRSLHQDNYHYIRRYEPFTPDSLFNDYRARQPAYKNWHSLFLQGKLNETQASFFKPQPAEGLYDLVKDPHQINNLAENPAYKKQLLSMRNQLNEHLKGLPDVGFFPESFVLKSSNLAIADFAQANKGSLANLIDIADLQLEPYQAIEKQLQRYLTTGTLWQKYWALIVATDFGVQANALTPAVNALLENNSSVLINARAIQFLATATNYQPAQALTELIARSKGLELVEVLNVAAQLKDARGFTLKLTMPKEWPKPKKGQANFFHNNSKYNMINMRIRFLNGDYDSK